VVFREYDGGRVCEIESNGSIDELNDEVALIAVSESRAFSASTASASRASRKAFIAAEARRNDFEHIPMLSMRLLHVLPY
jgi:hypothetical protein